MFGWAEDANAEPLPRPEENVPRMRGRGHGQNTPHFGVGNGHSSLHRLGPPVVPFLTPWEGSPTKIDYRKSWYPYSNLSTGGPSGDCWTTRIPNRVKGP